MSIQIDAEWVTVAEGYPQLKRFFRSKSALQYHLANRTKNGLAAIDAVRKSPLGILLIHPPRILDWLLAQPVKDAA